jgi:hypothetical protein
LTISDLLCKYLLKKLAAKHSEVQHVVDGDVGRVTWYQKTMAQMPES